MLRALCVARQQKRVLEVNLEIEAHFVPRRHRTSSLLRRTMPLTQRNLPATFYASPIGVAFRIPATGADCYELARVWQRSDLRPKDKLRYLSIAIFSPSFLLE